MAESVLSSPARSARLADPGLRRAVEATVRRRVRGQDADDVVQATYADVLSLREVPEDQEEFRRFVFGVARNKVSDHYRRQRHAAEELSENEHAAGEQPVAARDMLRWAETELPDAEARDTLQWMLREGDGEKLEHIARDARVPAPRVRKRVSRLRKLLRERWTAELTLAGIMLLVLLGALAYYGYGRAPSDVVKREPPRSAPPTPQPRLAPLPRTEPQAPAPSLPASDPPRPMPTPSAVPRANKAHSVNTTAKVPAPRSTSEPPRAARSDIPAPIPQKQSAVPPKASSLDIDAWSGSK